MLREVYQSSKKEIAEENKKIMRDIKGPQHD